MPILTYLYYILWNKTRSDIFIEVQYITLSQILETSSGRSIKLTSGSWREVQRLHVWVYTENISHHSLIHHFYPLDGPTLFHTKFLQTKECNQALRVFVVCSSHFLSQFSSSKLKLSKCTKGKRLLSEKYCYNCDILNKKKRQAVYN